MYLLDWRQSMQPELFDGIGGRRRSIRCHSFRSRRSALQSLVLDESLIEVGAAEVIAG